MNWDIIEGNWTKYKGHVKAQWGKLTNDRLEVIAGKREQLIGELQEAYGIDQDEADKQIKAFQKYLKASLPS
ncbi:MAG: CsbD family protein [Burkholderiaceae bacterium]